MGTRVAPVSGWGRYPVQSCELERPERYADLRPFDGGLIVRGQGRSYGDAALNEDGRVLLTERVNRLLDLDAEQGILRAEAGVTLAEILGVIVPKGWFLPVTPGTKFVSLGGCVAADVHGKNHHRDGSFCDHILGLEMILADGRRLPCSPAENAALFWATVGGMGLTGIIGEVTLKLIPIQNGYMKVHHRAAGNLEQLFQLLEDPAMDDRYTVAWLDSLATGQHLGRGIAMFGHHAASEDLPAGLDNSPKPGRSRAIPFDFPAIALNPASIGAFNAWYYAREGKKREPFLCGYDPYFYPLDAIGNWNRMYGKRGFVQYQCVIPGATAFDGIKALLGKLADSRRASFLAVLKRFGAQGKGLLSFPMAGYTLALDLPIRDTGLFELLDELDQIVLKCGGRIYLAKDARLSAESFRAMYPRYGEWLKIKNVVDPKNVFSSSLSRRLGVDGDMA
ncbi:MAG: FAD linked oxidase domain-containing protein [Gallionellaceae bacterium]|nr:MAG: FAD linked oxidase domain-containing protein [Gallionellaceae bacterium]